jgi:hypothetical protein
MGVIPRSSATGRPSFRKILPMFNLTEQKKNFVNCCTNSKKLSPKTIKAYSINPEQFITFQKVILIKIVCQDI